MIVIVIIIVIIFLVVVVVVVVVVVAAAAAAAAAAAVDATIVNIMAAATKGRAPCGLIHIERQPPLHASLSIHILLVHCYADSMLVSSGLELEALRMNRFKQ